MNKEQIDEIAFKVARESNLRLDNACGCSTCRERYDPPRIKAFTHALLAELVKVQEPIYLIRRKGFTDFYTCGYARLNTVSNHPELFEVKMVYEHPLPQPDLVAEIERVKTIADNYFAIATERSQQLSAAQQAIATQAAEIAELDALRNDAVLRLDKYKALVAEAIDKSGSCIICGFHPEMAAMWCDDYLKLKSLLENKHE